MHSKRDFFDSLIDSFIPYVCFEGHHDADTEMKPTLHIITPRKSDFVKIAGLKQLHGAVDKRSYFVEFDNENTHLDIMLYEKGEGVFPERLESEMLNQRIVNRLNIYVPEPNTQVVCRMYQQVIHRGMFDKETREIYLYFLKKRCGIGVGGVFPSFTVPESLASFD